LGSEKTKRDFEGIPTRMGKDQNVSFWDAVPIFINGGGRGKLPGGWLRERGGGERGQKERREGKEVNTFLFQVAKSGRNVLIHVALNFPGADVRTLRRPFDVFLKGLPEHPHKTTGIPSASTLCILKIKNQEIHLPHKGTADGFFIMGAKKWGFYWKRESY